MFRFPLRSQDAVLKSELSEKVYTPADVLNLFDTLESDAPDLLLFLTHLQHIEVFEKRHPSDENPRKLLDVQIEEDCLQPVAEYRKQFVRSIQDNKLLRTTQTHEPISVCYPMVIRIQKYCDGAIIQTEIRQFVISLYCAGSDTVSTKISEISKTLKVLPWVGVALPIDIKKSNDSDGYYSPTNSKTSSFPEASGRIFCFLPLPKEAKSPTGLRFHVHGYFSLNQNRRHIKWPSGDQQTQNLQDPHLIWNIFLLKTLIPKAALNLAVHLTQLSTRQESVFAKLVKRSAAGDDSSSIKWFLCNLVYSIMPDITTYQWEPLADVFYREIFSKQQKLFFSPVSGGNWHCAHGANAIFVDGSDTSQLVQIIRDIMSHSKTIFLPVPPHVTIGVEKYNGNVLQKHSPTTVCHMLKATEQSLKFTDGDKLILLDYLLNGVGDFADLIGLKLLPIDNGEWTTFKLNIGQMREEIYIPSQKHQQQLLPGLNQYFIRANLTDSCMQHMADLATQGKFFSRGIY